MNQFCPQMVQIPKIWPGISESQISLFVSYCKPSSRFLCPFPAHKRPARAARRAEFQPARGRNRTCAGRESNPRPPGWEAAGPTIGLIPRWRSAPERISYASKIQALTAGAAQRLIRHPKCAFWVVCWAVLLKSDKSNDFVAQA